MEGPQTPVPFLNLEYFFRLLYESRLSVTGEADVSLWEVFSTWFMHAWGVLGMVSFVFTIAGFLVLVYCSMRAYQIHQHEEHHKFSTITPEVAEERKDHARWAHIQTLIAGSSESEWRQAIIEADIMLEEVLMQAGYAGVSVGDKLKNASFKTLDDAWEAHKLRNDIAHRGSAFHLSDKQALHAIQRYERVFTEFGEI